MIGECRMYSNSCVRDWSWGSYNELRIVQATLFRLFVATTRASDLTWLLLVLNIIFWTLWVWTAHTFSVDLYVQSHTHGHVTTYNYIQEILLKMRGCSQLRSLLLSRWSIHVMIWHKKHRLNLIISAEWKTQDYVHVENLIRCYISV